MFFKKRKKQDISTPMMDKDPMNDNYIFDIKGNYSRGNFVTSTGSTEKSQKITIKPINVLDELKDKPRFLDLENLDGKIEMVKDRLEFIRNTYAEREINGLIQCLENRKKYKENKAFFSQFETTTLEKIEKLTEKYELIMDTIDKYIPELPDEAIKTMKEYQKNVQKIVGKDKKAVFYMIATYSDFREADGKRDPILLAQSPFGFYYDILGAWDKEMLLLSEL
ncbi:MAG: hypothetical protein JETCAE03_34880 [Ignavibacteriaceae bacterium]|jgi:molecular chaperone DnaK (HSP70)|nr:MAG: hypothetical protein JETCAE03_34880 [Ignavibacteriaceae bacterium]